MSDLRTKVVAFVDNVVKAMGLDLKVSAEEHDDGIRVDLTGGDGSEILVRRKGEVLDALQQVTNAAFRPHLTRGQHIVVDCMNFRRAKDTEVEQMAAFLVERARTSGMPQEIGPLNPYARRLVHLAVAEHPDATSESIGDAYLKTVLISVRKG